LKKRFDEDFRIFRSRDFMELLEQYEEIPERVKINGIVSLETIRSKNILSRMKAVSPDFDMVIVDEAHHLRNPGNKQWQAGTLLSENSTAMVMLTATPVQLGRENLFTLLKILDSQEFPEKHGAEERFRINENIVMAQNAISAIDPASGSSRKYLDEKAGRYSIIRETPHYHWPECLCEALSQEMDIMEEEDVRIKS
jgi:SNF2 family DNA or RNA helicase